MLETWVEKPRIEPLKDGVRVVAAGPPNAGKSSLVNAIAGQERAIVTDVPGTTRDHIEVPLLLGGIPVLLTDTAGLRDAVDPVERIGVERAQNLLDRADILLWLGAPGEAPDHPRLLRLYPRCDQPGREVAPPETLAVSSATGEGIDRLLEQVTQLSRKLLPAEDALALNRRQAAHIAEATTALRRASDAGDLVIVAEDLRAARSAFDRLTGRAGMEDVLDALFGRFCLGK